MATNKPYNSPYLLLLFLFFSITAIYTAYTQQNLSLLLIFSFTSICIAYNLPNSTRTKQTQLVVYVHDHFSGDDASAITVAGKLGAASNILHFGTVAVVDDLVTEGPDPNSRVLGRARGAYVNSAKDGSSLYMVFSLVFTEGEFKDSTLEIQGDDPMKKPQREFSVVSGTGLFRFATGYGIMETHFVDILKLRGIIKLSITLRQN